MHLSHNCDPLYAGQVYLQSYVILLVTTILAELFQAICINVIIPIAMSWWMFATEKCSNKSIEAVKTSDTLVAELPTITDGSEYAPTPSDDAKFDLEIQSSNAEQNDSSSVSSEAKPVSDTINMEYPYIRSDREFTFYDAKSYLEIFPFNLNDIHPLWINKFNLYFNYKKHKVLKMINVKDSQETRSLNKLEEILNKSIIQTDHPIGIVSTCSTDNCLTCRYRKWYIPYTYQAYQDYFKSVTLHEVACTNQAIELFHKSIFEDAWLLWEAYHAPRWDKVNGAFKPYDSKDIDDSVTFWDGTDSSTLNETQVNDQGCSESIANHVYSIANNMINLMQGVLSHLYAILIHHIAVPTDDASATSDDMRWLLYQTTFGRLSSPFAFSIASTSLFCRGNIYSPLFKWYEGSREPIIPPKPTTSNAIRIFDILQIMYLLASIISNIRVVTNMNELTLWNKYQIFNGILVNSVYLQSIFVITSNTIRYRYEYTIFEKVCMCIVYLGLGGFITHTLPAFCIYIWVGVAFMLVTIIPYILFIYVLGICWKVGNELFGQTVTLDDFVKICNIADRIYFRFQLILWYQTYYNYMYLYYIHTENTTLTSEMYWNIIVDEYDYRSHTLCLVDHFKDTSITILTFFNWL